MFLRDIRKPEHLAPPYLMLLGKSAFTIVLGPRAMCLVGHKNCFKTPCNLGNQSLVHAGLLFTLLAASSMSCCFQFINRSSSRNE